MKIFFKILVGICGWITTYNVLIIQMNSRFGHGHIFGGGYFNLNLNQNLQFLNLPLEIGLFIILNAFIWFKILNKINDYKFLVGTFLAIISLFWFWW